MINCPYCKSELHFSKCMLFLGKKVKCFKCSKVLRNVTPIKYAFPFFILTVGSVALLVNSLLCLCIQRIVIGFVVFFLSIYFWYHFSKVR